MSLPDPVVPDPPGLRTAVEQFVTSRVPVCGPDDTAGTVRDALVGARHDVVDDIAVCDPEDGRLLGVIPGVRLSAAESSTPVRELMDPDPPVVTPGLDGEPAAWKAVEHGEVSLAVVDDDGSFRGFVPPTRLLAALLRTHDEDFARLGGYLSSTSSARVTFQEPLRRRLWHRVPWLMLGLAGAAASAWVVGGFDDRLDADVRLAFFIPGVVYMADAVGAQTDALIIRGLSVGASMRRGLWREAVTGALMGLIFFAVSFPAVLLVLGSADLALTVAITLFAASTVATLVAVVLPLALHRSGRDPAFGSGPLGTVVRDLLSLLIYFAVATLVTG